jgi:hypothetical protein
MFGLGTGASKHFPLFLSPGLGMHLMTVINISGWNEWVVGDYGWFQMVLQSNIAQTVVSGHYIL